MDAVKGCVKQNGCAVRQQSAKNNDPTQVWILQRAN
jgi:hypothetical protein